MTESTFAMIKPHATRAHAGEILEMIVHQGIVIRRLETRQLSPDDAQFLYEEHKGCDFYDALVEYTISGPVVLMELMYSGKTPSVGYWRLVMGATKGAAEPTIRGKYANPDVARENAVHGSDSRASAERELMYFFPDAFKK